MLRYFKGAARAGRAWGWSCAGRQMLPGLGMTQRAGRSAPLGLGKCVCSCPCCRVYWKDMGWQGLGLPDYAAGLGDGQVLEGLPVSLPKWWVWILPKFVSCLYDFGKIHYILPRGEGSVYQNSYYMHMLLVTFLCSKHITRTFYTKMRRFYIEFW